MNPGEAWALFVRGLLELNRRQIWLGRCEVSNRDLVVLCLPMSRLFIADMLRNGTEEGKAFAKLVNELPPSPFVEPFVCTPALEAGRRADREQVNAALDALSFQIRSDQIRGQSVDPGESDDR